MDWDVDVSDEFLGWNQSLNKSEWESVNVAVAKLEHYGPTLGRPYVDTLIGSKYPNMKSFGYGIRAGPTACYRLRPSPQCVPDSGRR
jgi:hypothetical protein